MLYLCEKCGATLKTRLEQRHHNRTCSASNPPVYTCCLCTRKYVTHHSLNRHSKNAHGMALSLPKRKRPIKCEKCGKRVTPTRYSAHLNLHAGKRPFKCSICPKAYPGQASLNRHWAQQHGVGGCDTSIKQSHIEQETNTPVLLEYPGKSEPTVVTSDLSLAEKKLQMIVSIPVQITVRAEQRQHSQSRNVGLPGNTLEHNLVSLRGKGFQCLLCSKVYANRQSLWKHRRDKPQTKTALPNNLSGCDKRPCLKHSHCQQKHESAGCPLPALFPGSKLSPTARGFPCCCCDVTLDSLKAYRTHLFTHSATSHLLCTVCGRRYASVVRLWLHQKKTHSRYQSRRYRGSSKRSKPSVLHRPSMHNRKKKCFRRCNRNSSCKSCPTKHRKRELSQEKVTECPSSSQTLDLTPVLPLEPLVVPFDRGRYGRGYKCVICGKVLTRKLHFRNHMSLHTGEWPYTCHHCEKSFPNYRKRRQHIEQEHADLVRKTARKPAKHCSHSPPKKKAKTIETEGGQVLKDTAVSSTEASTVCKGTLQQHNVCVNPNDQCIRKSSTKCSRGEPTAPDQRRRFACQQCNKSYVRASDLKRHVLFKHPLPPAEKHMKLRGPSHKHLDGTCDPATQSCQGFPPGSKIGETDTTVNVNCMFDVVDMGLRVSVQEVAEQQPTPHVTVSHQSVERSSVLPVCGEIQVEDKHAIGDQHSVYAVSSDTVMKKHGSWNVFYFTDNPIS